MRYTVIAGASLVSRDETLADLRRLLLIDGPILLLLISLAGYLIAALALSPVDRMRRRADRVSATDLAERLPVTPARDEIGALGKTLNRMLDRLEIAFAHERAFVADASHELRTPLTVLRAELDLALSGRSSPEELEAAVRSAIEESDRLIALSDSLLELARADRGLELETVPVEVAVAVGAVAERLLPAARSNGVEIEISDAGPAVVEADPLGLDQALFNLLDNAIRYADQRVEVVVADSVQRAEILVRDDGPGFPAELRESAFDRFVRADRDRRGTGLGLSIVAAVADAHGGAVGLRNRSAGGAEVWISLPRTEANRGF